MDRRKFMKLLLTLIGALPFSSHLLRLRHQQAPIVKQATIIKKFGTTSLFFDGDNNSNTNLLLHYEGFVRDIKTFPGEAKWTENFTPPTEPYKK